ncbi:type I polyketide synthase [Parvularcula marina]|uniref:type I polyketide synthase n=1 Tax=Parvularcula marina TaxID=2292771 RepID=UPI00351411F9
MTSDMQAPGIAIIGMSGRFPGAKNVDEFWENIKQGRDTVTHFIADELDPVVQELAGDSDYVCAKGMLDDIDQFDAAFWGMLPREAEVMDPQHRVFLEICWEAIEGAGYDASRYEGAIGCFGGCYMDTYVLHNLCSDEAFRRNLVQSIQVGTLQTELGNDKDYLATRVAFKLGLRGPAINMQTACSTSLVSIATACQSLEAYACDMALAGGVTIVLPQFKGYQYKEGSMLSPDGTCRPFDARAAGTVFSNGAAVVLLKRLEDAIADGDTIHAVIRGYATNNDGDGKVSYTAPSPEGQAEVISLAMGMADIDARSIGYMEAHGTATPLGDPIEVAGLTAAHRAYTDDRHYCALGSVKGNLGHLDVSSGAIGTIKTALTLRDAVIPPLAHFEAPNPKIDFENSPFYVNTELVPFPKGAGPRRAAVSSFGVGGTNAHLVLEEPPEAAALPQAEGPFLLPFSARTETALTAMAAGLGPAITQSDAPLSDIAATLQRGRKTFQRRGFVVASTREDAAAGFDRPEMGLEPAGSPKLCFLYTGQGAQYPGMGAALYEASPAYRDCIDRVAETLKADPDFGHDIRDWLLDPSADASQLQHTEFAQVCLLAVEAGMSAALAEKGVTPDAVIGHSVGELAASVTAGILSLEEAARFTARRGRLMGGMPKGGMLGVKAPRALTERHLREGAVIAGVNSPAISVVSGTADAIIATETSLREAEIEATRLAVSHGFHSPSMREAAEMLGAPMDVLSASENMQVYSTFTGERIDAARWGESAYWREQMLGPVLFLDAVSAAMADGFNCFIEVGPGSTLAALTMQSAEEEVSVITSLGPAKQPGDARATMLSALGKYWTKGGDINWDAVQPGAFRRVNLPTYPFDRKRFWVEPSDGAASTEPVSDERDDLAGLIRQQLGVVEAQLKAMKGK